MHIRCRIRHLIQQRLYIVIIFLFYSIISAISNWPLSLTVKQALTSPYSENTSSSCWSLVSYERFPTNSFLPTTDISSSLKATWVSSHVFLVKIVKLDYQWQWPSTPIWHVHVHNLMSMVVTTTTRDGRNTEYIRNSRKSWNCYIISCRYIIISPA